MKKLLSVVFITALAISLSAQTIDVMNMTEGLKGNQRVPAVAENARGERVYVYRGGDLYVHYRYYKNGSWGKATRIPGSPVFNGEFWYSDIVADNSGTIHYVCEETDSHMWYAYFKDGAWSTMKQIDVPHEATLSLAVRSDDTVVLAAAMKTFSPKLTKDVVIGTKRKDQTNFSNFVNVTQDWEASTMVDLAIDAQDNSWIVYKDEFFKTESMPVTLLTLDKNHKQTYFKNVSGQEETRTWCWYARVGINTEGKVMATWFKSQASAYYSRCYDPTTKSWTDIKQIINGPLHPWPEMYNQVLARGTDFYWIGMTPDRYVRLYKYDAAHNSWTKVGDVSTAGANWFNASNGANCILIAWDTQSEPMSSYLTTVSADPYVATRVQSVANLLVEKRVERGFFHGYTLNVLTWEANPLNVERDITIASQRVYRKLRTEDAGKWALLIELAGDVRAYEDRNIPAGSDYVYAVTCIDDMGVESAITDEGQGASGVAGTLERRIEAERKDR